MDNWIQIPGVPEREFQERDPDLEVTDIYMTFDIMAMDEGTEGHVQTKKRLWVRTGALNI